MSFDAMEETVEYFEYRLEAARKAGNDEAVRLLEQRIKDLLESDGEA